MFYAAMTDARKTVLKHKIRQLFERREFYVHDVARELEISNDEAEALLQRCGARSTTGWPSGGSGSGVR